jgi:hypothetical protein
MVRIVKARSGCVLQFPASNPVAFFRAIHRQVFQVIILRIESFGNFKMRQQDVLLQFQRFNLIDDFIGIVRAWGRSLNTWPISSVVLK